MLKKSMKKIIVIMVLLFLFTPQAGFAQRVTRIVPECAYTDVAGCQLCDFFVLIKNIFNFIAFNLAPPVAGIFIVAAGFLFLASGGSEERVKQAKKIFLNVVIGLVVIYASWLFVNSLVQIIAKDVDGFSKDSWYEFSCQ
jgi:hypothetical protein